MWLNLKTSALKAQPNTSVRPLRAPIPEADLVISEMEHSKNDAEDGHKQHLLRVPVGVPGPAQKAWNTDALPTTMQLSQAYRENTLD